MKNRTRIVIVATAVLILLGMACRKYQPREHQQRSNPTTTATTLDQVTRQMIQRGYYPISLRNDWPDSAMIVLPPGIASVETTRFVSSGEERTVFAKPGRHTAKLLMKKHKQWKVDIRRFTVSVSPMSGYGWSPSWAPNRASYGWVRCWVVRPQHEG